MSKSPYRTTNGERVRLFTIVASIVAWFGLLLQLYLSLRMSLANGKTISEGLFAFFGYFTILTNVLVALTITVPLVATGSRIARFFSRPGVVTAVASAILLVGIAYFFLLRNVWSPEGWQLLADVVLHYVTPILFLAYWWVAAPKQGLRVSDIPIWAGYPVGYFGYMLIRGGLTGRYPYYFLDAQSLGYVEVLFNAVIVLLLFALVSIVLLGASRLQKVHVHASRPS